MRLLLFALALLITTPASAAGFDCREAKLPTEHTICSNQELNTLDGTMSSLYYEVYDRVKRENKDAAKLLASIQRAWITVRNDCGHYPNCIANAYYLRFVQLCWFSSWESKWCNTEDVVNLIYGPKDQSRLVE